MRIKEKQEIWVQTSHNLLVNIISYITDGANNARDFFSENNREKVLDLFKVDDVDREKIRRILRDINVIGRIANSTRKIDIPKFKKFCTDAYVFKVEAFEWPSLTVSLHRFQSSINYGC